MNKTKALIFTTLCAMSASSFAEQPNTLPKEIREKLEYDLITWKTRDNTVKDVRNWSAKFTALSIICFIGSLAWNFEKIKEILQTKDISLVPFSTWRSMDAISLFSKLFLANWVASQYTKQQVNELEKAIKNNDLHKILQQ